MFDPEWSRYTDTAHAESELEELPGDGTHGDFAAELASLAQSAAPDPAFVARLEMRLQEANPVAYHTPITPAYRIEHPVTPHQPAPRFQSFHLLRALGGTAAALILIAFLTMTVPPLRSFAQEILRFFQRAATNQVTTEVRALNPAELQNLNIVGVDDLPHYRSVAQVGAAAGFALKTPVPLPVGYTFSSGIAQPGSATLFYTGPESSLLELTQARVSTAVAPIIGAGAVVESVEVGGVSAEYVKGTWSAVTLDLGQIRGPMTVNSNWDADAAQHTLRWQSGGFVYQLVSRGDKNMSKVALVSLARTLK